jgi:adenosylcobinamide-phosphate synthase
MLGGDSYYFGELVRKPTIGDDDRPIEPGDIPRANRLLYATAFLFIIVCILAKGAIVGFDPRRRYRRLYS